MRHIDFTLYFLQLFNFFFGSDRTRLFAKCRVVNSGFSGLFLNFCHFSGSYELGFPISLTVNPSSAAHHEPMG